MRILNTLFPDKPLTKKWVRCDASGLLSQYALATTPAKAFWNACLSYEDPIVRDMIWALKYRGDKRAVKICAHILEETLIAELSDNIILESDRLLIVPIPLSGERLRERGFNQMELVAQELVRRNPKLWKTQKGALEKIRDTKPQTELAGNTRRKNLKGVFTVNPRAVSGKICILIDDVATTGSTLAETRRALKKAGAAMVLACAVAH